MDSMMIRNVRLEDAPRLVEIYSYYVLNTAVSFEYDVPSVEDFVSRIKSITEKFPYLVCEVDGRIVGYAYASAYSLRQAYSWTAATSIYLDKDYRRRGIGSMLYDALEEKLKKQGIVNLLAGAAFCEKEDEYLTHDSKEYHISRGYSQVAHLKSLGQKFDRWYDLLWFQKNL